MVSDRASTVPLPDSARVPAPADLASALAHAVAALPAYEDKALYDLSVQQGVLRTLREVAGGAFDDLTHEILRCLDVPPHVAYVTGLRYDTNNLLFVGLSGAFGDVVDPYDQSWSRLVRYIRPSTDRAVDGRGILNESLHTDGTDWRRPNDLTCLLCVQPDQNGGGRSRLLDIEHVTAGVRATLGVSALAALETRAVPWRVADELGGGTVEAPVLGRRGMRWLRYTIAQELPGEVRKAVDGLERMLEDSAEVMEFVMEAGALQIVDNTRCLHARTSIPEPAASSRLVLRTKVFYR
jgi:hypothetical protein